MNEDELNKFHNDSIINKYGLNEMISQLQIDELIKDFPAEGTYKEKRTYLDTATKENIIHSYSPIYTEGKENEDCQFSLVLYGTNERLLI